MRVCSAESKQSITSSRLLHLYTHLCPHLFLPARCQFERSRASIWRFNSSSNSRIRKKLACRCSSALWLLFIHCWSHTANAKCERDKRCALVKLDSLKVAVLLLKVALFFSLFFSFFCSHSQLERAHFFFDGFFFIFFSSCCDSLFFCSSSSLIQSKNK